jgi:hypothetical protein
MARWQGVTHTPYVCMASQERGSSAREPAFHGFLQEEASCACTETSTVSQSRGTARLGDRSIVDLSSIVGDEASIEVQSPE